MIGLVIISVLTAITGTVLFIQSREEIKSMTSQLKEINEHPTNQKITVGSSQKIYSQLAVEMNKLIHAKQETEVRYARMDKELKEAITNISHDFRTPLTSVKGYLQLLQEDGMDGDKDGKYLETVINRTKSLNELIEDFYELSQVNSGDYKMVMEPVHIDRIFCELIADFYKEFVDKSLNPQVEIEQNLPAAWADAKSVNRVFLNFIQNALRYAKHEFKVSMKLNGDRIKVIFSNEAGGLNEEEAGRIFERSFMSDRSRNKKGTGIGLAVAKKLTEKMDAKISAHVRDGILFIETEWKISPCQEINMHKNE